MQEGFKVYKLGPLTILRNFSQGAETYLTKLSNLMSGPFAYFYN